MSCGLTHSAAPTGGAEASAFATERDEVLVVAGLTLDAQETVGKDPAAEVLVKFPDHEIWKRISGILLNLILERQPVVLDELVKDRFFRFVSGVGELFFCKIGIGHTREGCFAIWRSL